MWAGLPDKERHWRWFYSTTLGLTFSIAVFLGIIGSVATWRRTPKISKLEERIAELEENLVQQQSEYFDLLAQQRTGYYKLLTDQLSVLARSIRFGDSERISVYKHDGKAFAMLGRYSLNPEYRKPGRVFYPDNEGCIGAAWGSMKDSRCFVDDLPNSNTNPREYQERLTNEWGIAKDTVQRLRMKSRTYAAFPILDSTDTKRVAVIVFESTRRKAFSYNELRNVLAGGEERRISNFMERMQPQEPAFTYASNQGY